MTQDPAWTQNELRLGLLHDENRKLRAEVTRLEEQCKILLAMGLAAAGGLVERNRLDILERLHVDFEAALGVAEEIRLYLDEMPDRRESVVLDAVCRLFDSDGADLD